MADVGELKLSGRQWADSSGFDEALLSSGISREEEGIKYLIKLRFSSSTSAETELTLQQSEKKQAKTLSLSLSDQT